jgi:8-oxo-dGTP pyrophosphatase MutT (NUDIX family)
MKKVKNGPYLILASKNIYKNPWMQLREDIVMHLSGKQGIFGVVEMKNGSSVLAVNNKNEVYLVKEFKYSIKKESVETMSGGLDNNESPLKAAKRELKEELGLEAKKWINLGYVDPFTNVIKSKNYMFLAFDLKKTKSCPDSEESIKIIKMPFKKAVTMVRQGEITHSASCVLILKAEKYLKP